MTDKLRNVTQIRDGKRGLPGLSPFLSDAIAIGVIFFAVIVVYWPARHFDFVNLDDPQYVYVNETVRTGLNWQSFKWAFASTTGGLWQPMTMLSLLLDVKIHGVTPGPMHVENVLLHACSSVGWFLLLRVVTGRKLPAFFAAAIFAVHPARVESVVWITERKDVLSMFMLVCSLLAWWQYVRWRSVMAYLLSFTLFCLALMSKAMVVSQPILMLLLDVWPLARTRFWRPVPASAPKSMAKLVLEKSPFFLLSILSSILALQTQKQVGARPDLKTLPLSERLITAVYGYARYLGELLWPRHLAIYYPFQHHVPPVVVFASTALLVLLTGLIFRFGKSRPQLPVGWIWFIVALVPVCGLFQAGDQSMADRFTYLPSIGLTFAAVWFVADAVAKYRSTAVRGFAILGGLGVCIALAASTREYLNCWRDSVALFTRAEEVNGKTDSVIETHLADALVAAGRPDLAADHYEISLSLNAYDSVLQINLGNLLMRADPQLALDHYHKATLIKPQDATAHYDYGVCLNALHRNAEGNVQLDLARQLKLSHPSQ